MMYLDLDIASGNISVPGSLNALVVDREHHIRTVPFPHFFNTERPKMHPLAFSQILRSHFLHGQCRTVVISISNHIASRTT